MGTPQLNIKDAETARLVRELTALTGENKTEAVRKALRERLEREKAERDDRGTRVAAEKRREFQKIWAKIQKFRNECAEQGWLSRCSPTTTSTTRRGCRSEWGNARHRFFGDRCDLQR